MPRSFLIKKLHGSKRAAHGGVKSQTEEASCRTHEDFLLLSDPPTHCRCLAPSLQLQQSAHSLSFQPPSVSADGLLLPSSPNAPPLSLFSCSSEAHSGGPTEAHRAVQSSNKVSPEMQGGARSLLPPHLPLLAFFPARPPSGSSQGACEGLDWTTEHLSFSGVAKQLQSERNFSCKHCEKEYISLGALKMHIRTHTLPCVCKLCGKAFSRPWLLQGHIRTHTGEKPFSCLHCSRAFADRSNLRAHIQTHSQVKKYQCASCLKTFSRISLLARHQEAGCHWDSLEPTVEPRLAR